MDYAELFERQGRAVDEVLVHAFALPEDRFAAPGPAGGPSLRDLLVEWLETQRRAVHASLQGHPWRPLPAASVGTVPAISQAFGGFRLTLRDALEATFREDLSRRVTWHRADGGTQEVALDELLAHLVLHGARTLGLVAARLRELGVADVPPTDLLG